MYNSTQAGIDAVRVECGNLLPDDTTDATITEKLNGAFSQVQIGLGRSLTDVLLEATDVGYYFVKELEVKIAAKNTLKAYGPEFLDKIRELQEEVDKDMQFLRDNITVLTPSPSGGSLPYVYTAPPLTFPKNPDAPIYRSTRGGADALYCCFSVDRME